MALSLVGIPRQVAFVCLNQRIPLIVGPVLDDVVLVHQLLRSQPMEGDWLQKVPYQLLHLLIQLRRQL